MGAISDYVYRKEFGLSYKDFLGEPYDAYQNNQLILEAIGDINRVQQKKLERSARK